MSRGPSIATLLPLISGDSHLAGISFISAGLPNRQLAAESDTKLPCLLCLLHKWQKPFDAHPDRVTAGTSTETAEQEIGRIYL